MVLSYDIALFYSIHSLLHQSVVGDFIIRFFAQYAVFVLIAIFIIALRHIHTTHQERFKTLVLATASVVFTHFIAAPLIYFWWQRPRPFVGLGASHLFIVDTFSFPSGHTMLSFAIATILYFYNRKVAWILYGLGALIGVARVAAGVHYPLDILGGAIIGILIAATTMFIYRFLAKKKNY